MTNYDKCLLIARYMGWTVTTTPPAEGICDKELKNIHIVKDDILIEYISIKDEADGEHLLNHQMAANPKHLRYILDKLSEEIFITGITIKFDNTPGRKVWKCTIETLYEEFPSGLYTEQGAAIFDAVTSFLYQKSVESRLPNLIEK